MTSAEQSYIRYHRLKDAGLCPKCGKERDNPNRVHCTACATKNYEITKADRDWYLEHRICPSCKKQDLLGDEHRCPECRAKTSELSRKYRLAMDREEYNKQMNELNKKAYNRLREQGLCVLCRRKVENPEKHAKCEWCRAKYRLRHEEKMLQRGEIVSKTKQWQMQGLCYLCGSECYGKYKVCKKHYDSLIERRKGGKKIEQVDSRAV